jgi:hypothetical protein
MESLVRWCCRSTGKCEVISAADLELMVWESPGSRCRCTLTESGDVPAFDGTGTAGALVAY